MNIVEFKKFIFYEFIINILLLNGRKVTDDKQKIKRIYDKYKSNEIQDVL